MKSITLINQYSGNKGYRAVCYYILRELSKYPGISITLSTIDRNSWKYEKIITENNIKLVPWCWNVENFNPGNRIQWERRRFMQHIIFPYLVQRIFIKKMGLGFSKFFVRKDTAEAIAESDLVISSGGHHLTTRFSPNLVNEIFFDIMAASLLNSQFSLWSQTIGPLSFTKLRNYNALKEILANSIGIFIRDIESKNILKELNIHPEKIHQTFESVIGLNDIIEDYIKPSERKNKVGITIYNAEYRTASDYKEYCSVMASISDWVIDQGYKVKFFPHEIMNSVVNDRKCILDIMDLIKSKEDVSFENNDYPTDIHLKEIANCKVFIGHKTHSIIFALTVGTPLIAISYHQKTIDFLKQYSLSQNIIIDSELTLENFKNKFLTLINDLDSIGLKQFERSREIATILSRDFIRMLEC